MRRHQSALALAVLSLIAAPSASAADGPTREDLSRITMTHGESFVPVRGHPDAAKGYIFRFQTQALGLMPKPAGGEQFSTQGLIETMRKEKTGDLFYAVGTSPVLLVVSGKARDIGAHYLCELGGQELEKPTEWPAADPAHNVPISGWIVAPAEGHVYLIETVDGKSALLRIVARGAGGMLMQWVAAENNGTKFEIPPQAMTMAAADNVDMPAAPTTATQPAGDPPVPATRPAAATGLTTRGVAGGVISPATQRGPARLIMGSTTTGPADATLVPYFGTWARQRAALVQDRIAKVGRAGGPLESATDTAEAMADLARIAAPEAVEMLVTHITFLNANARVEADPMVAHPAVGALIKIGKPASLAALKAIGELKPSNAPLEAPEYRTILLANVVLGVEGADVAELLFKRELAAADDAHRPYFEQCLRGLKHAEK